MNTETLRPYHLHRDGRCYPNIILGMQPQWAEKILDGSKSMELRRTRPGINKTVPPGTILYLYCRGHIIGHCIVVQYRELWTPADILIHAASAYKLAGMESHQAVWDYLNGAERPCLYHIRSAQRYAQPIPWPTVVQSWIYVPDPLGGKPYL